VVGIHFLREPLAWLTSERVGKVGRVGAVRWENVPALIREDRPDFCGAGVRTRSSGEVGELVDQGQEGPGEVREGGWMRT